MPNTQTISMDMILEGIKAHSWNYVTDSDGDYRVDFAPETKLERFHCYFTLRGAKKDLFNCFGYFDYVIPESSIAQAIYLCNQYHCEKYAPCAYVRVREDGSTKFGRFWCQEVYDLENGIHQEGLKNFMTHFIGSILSFEKWTAERL